ncbi:MAG TPA: helix-turn-helix transcriptional regulator [Solirubrobacterales bacterium]|nr:helix-turn-helix transcriptional regulator [Solirubrobacterales bacterium]
MTFREAFGERLLVARFNLRMSQEALAERGGIHPTQISLYELGRRQPMLESFVRLSGAVDLSPGELLGPIRWTPGVHGAGAFDFGEEEA